MDAQQELFTELLLKIKELGYDVYDGFLPPEDTQYPFVYMGDCSQNDASSKTDVFGNVYQTIHVWCDNPRNRGTVSKMLMNIKEVCMGLEHTERYAWLLQNATQRILPDTTTKTPLLHGILEVTYKFS